MAVKLSICIPTYNRADFLLQNLGHIHAQRAPGIEVVVSDNGSADDTAARVELFARSHPELPLRFIRHERNLGFCRNVLSVVEQAEGEYCWLLGDDDFALPGSVARVLREAEGGPTAILLNYSRFDARARKITAERMIGLRADRSFTDPAQFFFTEPGGSYFKHLGTNMITMSANVFRRQAWIEAAKGAERFVGRNMIHVFVLTAAIARDARIKFVSEPLVQYLCNNHRIWDNDIWADYRKNVYEHLEALGYDAKLLAAGRVAAINPVSVKDTLRQARSRIGRVVKGVLTNVRHSRTHQ